MRALPLYILRSWDPQADVCVGFDECHAVIEGKWSYERGISMRIRACWWYLLFLSRCLIYQVSTIRCPNNKTTPIVLGCVHSVLRKRHLVTSQVVTSSAKDSMLPENLLVCARLALALRVCCPS
jgi:hypothetical protein